MAAQAEIKAVITAEDKASGVVGGFGSSLTKMAGAMAIGQIAAQALTYAFDRVVDATKASVGAAFDQVRQVQNASFALRAYERDADKVNMVLKDLVAFARSDMGVLFKREELFKAASNLRAFGVASDQITDKVKILARGVSLGMTSFDELSQIIGRVIQKGRLDANEFDMLAQRGIVLSSSFRGAAVSSEQLFTELQRVLPEDLLKGRANTIDGLMIRLDSSFRDLGSSILGVNKDTSEFIKGGLGDTMIQGLTGFRDLLASPELKNALAGLGQGLAILGIWLGEQIPKAIDVLRQAWVALQPAFQRLWDIIQAQLVPALKDLWVAIEPYAPYLGQALVIAIVSVVAVLALLVISITVVVRAVTLLANAFNWLMGMASALGTAVGNAFANMVTSVLIWYVQNKAFVDGVINAFRGFVGFLGAWGGAVFHGLTWPFVTAFNVISSIISSIRNNIGTIGNIARIIAPIPGFATGVQNFGGGLAVVGERGPELVNLPRGSDVIPNNQVGGGTNTTININVGMMTGSATEQREAAMRIFENLQDIANTKGQSVAQMMGV